MVAKPKDAASTPPLTWTLETAYDQQLAWLIKLSHLSAWKDHAWHRAKELDAEPSGLFKGIKADLVKAMTFKPFVLAKPSTQHIITLENTHEAI